MSKHTPGPWLLTTSGSEVEGVNVTFHIRSDERVSIASGQSQEHLPDSGIHEEECIANANLIAAAPDLLAALEEAIDMIDIDSNISISSPMAIRWKEAVAKARGEP